MKASLNASARDAQVRDSFNKESFVVEGSEMVKFCAKLFDLQRQLPRNASKLHSLVVLDASTGTSFLLNFEVLRSIPFMDDCSLEHVQLFVESGDSRKKTKSKSKDEEKEEESHDN